MTLHWARFSRDPRSHVIDAPGAAVAPLFAPLEPPGLHVRALGPAVALLAGLAAPNDARAPIAGRDLRLRFPV